MSLSTLNKRVSLRGNSPQERMISGKLQSLLSAINHSYHSAIFKTIENGEEQEKEIKGIFETVTITTNYDSKMISVENNQGVSQGSYIKWLNGNSIWIVILQHLTELAYFRGTCRKCNYKIRWVDGDRQLQEEYLSIVGPSANELRTSSSSNSSISVDVGNGNLTIFVKNTERNKSFFKRYQSLLIDGTSYRIENIDLFSMEGIIEISALETFGNNIEDDVEENIRNAFNVLPVIAQNGTETYIEGALEMLPYNYEVFSTPFENGEWSIVENEEANTLPVSLTIGKDSRQVAVYWDSLVSGKFTLRYKMDDTDYQKIIYVKSLT